LRTAIGPRLAHRLLGGAAAEIGMPITDIKTIPFHAFWRAAVATRVTYGRIRDYLAM
jgi:hypothetical protein